MTAFIPDVENSIVELSIVDRVLKDQFPLTLNERDSQWIFDTLGTQLGDKKDITVDEFSKAIDVVLTRFEREIDVFLDGTEERTVEIVTAKSIENLKRAKNAISTELFGSFFPLKLMLCWLDAFEVVLDTIQLVCKTLGDIRFKIRATQNSRKADIIKGLFEVQAGASILAYRVGRQMEAYINTPNPEEKEEILFEEYTAQLARDIVYLYRLKKEHEIVDYKDPDEIDQLQVDLSRSHCKSVS